jgi:hypothetical protein
LTERKVQGFGVRVVGAVVGKSAKYLEFTVEVPPYVDLTVPANFPFRVKLRVKAGSPGGRELQRRVGLSLPGGRAELLDTTPTHSALVDGPGPLPVWERWLPLMEAARHAGISSRTVSRWKIRGWIQTRPVGKFTLVSMQSVLLRLRNGTKGQESSKESFGEF